MYNPDGGRAAADYSFPYASATFDMVMLKSVFTHMMPADLSRYMSEVGRVLKPGGRSVISYFLLNDESRRYIARGADKMGLVHELEGDRLCRIANLEVPEAVVAHDEARIRGMYADAGMSLSEVVYGDWCGRQSLLGLQDFIVGIKETPAASDRDAIRDSEAAADAASR
jgi:SAM-dependent methyltransferase